MTVTVSAVDAALPAGSLVSIDISTPTTPVFKPVDDFLSAVQIAQDADNIATPAGQDVNMIASSDGAEIDIPDPNNAGQTIRVRPRFYSVTCYRRIVVDEVLAPLV
ncbi:hypothetical protein [Oscillatoria acuminata]|uniref:Uncharacterized protein n=1 Tax=Oscillatoria acuminata PCC 6304 TaxID=56110 RepID=K9TCK5_9CYAN|nr:hypothetical protein [Oscillatoria acuminata]AFY80163.1 hypothetical protein Oscil6304_0413 [Oscillatoria acuminata PCC 6304]